MSKKYEHIENEPMMAGEPNVALRYNRAPQKIVVSFHTNRDDISEAISGEELKNRLHQSLKSRFHEITNNRYEGQYFNIQT